MLCEGAVVSAGWHRSWEHQLSVVLGGAMFYFHTVLESTMLDSGITQLPALLPPPHFTVLLVC